MKSRIGVLFGVIVAAGCLAGCLTGPIVMKPDLSPEYRPEILDDIYHQVRAVPDWIFWEAAELEAQMEDEYLFKAIETGKSLEGLKAWARGFTASSEIARMVSTEVRTKFAGAAAGDKDLLEIYIEETVKSVSRAKISGARQKAQYWWLVRKTHADGSVEDVYEYFLLFSVPQIEVDLAIQRAFAEGEESSQPASKEEAAARQRVKDSFE